MEKFGKLSKDNKIETLFSAIDFMSQYNGRSRIKCIALAMDFEFDGVHYKVAQYCL